MPGSLLRLCLLMMPCAGLEEKFWCPASAPRALRPSTRLIC